MEILFGGVRGTTPRADPAFAIYGGHTTCLLITGAGGERVLIDAGSGIHVLNRALADEAGPDLLVLFSHLHLDHVMGLPMLAALFDPEARIECAAVSEREDGPRDALERLISPPLWPIGLDGVPAEVSFRSVPAADLSAAEPALIQGGLEVRGCAVPHPNGCTAWRVDEPATGESFVLATDVEWSAAGEARREAMLALFRGADVLVMDGHFTAEELPVHAGWGHSSLDECVEAARAAGAGRLLVTHHAPERDDVELADLDARLNAMWSEAALARQEMSVSPGDTPAHERDDR